MAQCKILLNTGDFLLLNTGDNILLNDDSCTDDEGGGNAGSSKSVGVSMVDKQIREIVPPKRHVELSTPLHLHSQLTASMENSLRVVSPLYEIQKTSLDVSSHLIHTTKSKLNAVGHPLVFVGARTELTGSLLIPVNAELSISGRGVFSETVHLNIEVLKQKAMRGFYG